MDNALQYIPVLPWSSVTFDIQEVVGTVLRDETYVFKRLAKQARKAGLHRNAARMREAVKACREAAAWLDLPDPFTGKRVPRPEPVVVGWGASISVGVKEAVLGLLLYRCSSFTRAVPAVLLAGLNVHAARLLASAAAFRAAACVLGWRGPEPDVTLAV